jgi:hypothetical protein
MGLDLMTAQDVVPPQVPAVEIPFINVQSAPPSLPREFPTSTIEPLARSGCSTDEMDSCDSLNGTGVVDWRSNS